MRSVWKGHIRFLLVSIPVKVFNAVDTTETIKSNWLHRGCMGMVGMEKRCKKCSEVLSAADIANGYPYGEKQFAIIEADELKALKLESTHAIALGRLVLRQREELVTISPLWNGLVIQQLHFAHEVRNITDVPGVAGQAEVAENELELATTLVDQMETSFEELDMTDHYHVALKELINSKITGKAVVTAESKPAAQPLDIMAALQASLAAKAATKQTAPALELVKEKRPTTRKKKAA